MTKKNEEKSQLKEIYSKNGTKTALASVLSILAGLAVGSILILVVSVFNSDIGPKGGIEGLKLILFGLFSKGRDSVGELVFGFNPINAGNLLFRATPVIMTGLSVAVAFKTGLFNIGAPGQYLVGTAATLILALKIPSDVIPPFAIWIIAFSGGMLAGALWGAIPGILKAYLSINEVLACIMTNWIAANAVTWIFENSELRNSGESGKIAFIMKTSANGVATAKFGLDKIFPGSQVNGGIFIAVAFAVFVYIIITKTVLGYEMKACGYNKDAAEYAGIKSRRMIVFSMAFAGALSGGGAALYYLSGNTEFFWSTYQSLPTEGFNGIPIALLASNNPIGVIFTGLFMSVLSVAGQQLKNLTPYNEYITNIIIGIIVYLSAFSLVIKSFISSDKRNFKRKTTTADENTHSDEEIISQAQRQSEEGGEA